MSRSNGDRTWYRLILTTEQVEFGFVDILRAELGEIWIARGGPEGFTVWLQDCDTFTEIYLSPVAAAASSLVLTRFNAMHCDKPRLDSLTCLLGHDTYDDLMQE